MKSVHSAVTSIVHSGTDRIEKRINGSPVYMMFSSTDCHGKFSSPRYHNYFWNIFTEARS